jgi:Tfp pilus assembly protein PilV
MKHRLAHHRRGFLLIEAMIATVVLAVAALGITSLLLSAHEQQESIRETNTATLLGRQLMEEIAAKPFGPATPIVARSLMTYANQYNGYQDSTTAMTTLGTAETITPGDGELYSRQVTITAAATPTGSTAPTNDLQLITITVATPSGKSVVLTRLLTNVTWST